MGNEGKRAPISGNSPEREYYLNLEIDAEYQDYCRQFDQRIAERYRRKAEEIRSHLAPYVDLESAHILDLGCGRGAYGRILMGSRGRVTGLDLNFTELCLAKEVAGENQNYALGNGYSLPFASKIFDLVLCRHTLEHLSQPGEFLSEIHRVTKRSGVCYLSTPNLFSGSCVFTTADGRKWLDYKLTGKNRGVHRLYSLGSLRSAALGVGFERLEALPIPAFASFRVPSFLQWIRPTLKVVLFRKY